MNDNELLMRFLEPIEEAYRRRTKRSAELHARAREFLPGGNTRSTTYFSPHPLYIERADGCRLHDVDGNVLVDFLGNYTSMILGHNHPKVNEAVERQLKAVVSPGACTENVIELAGMICKRYPSLEKLRFCNSGTEANLYAIKAARAFTGREKVVVVEGAYHGGYDWFNLGFNLDPKTFIRLPDPSIPQSVSKDVLLVPFNDFEAAGRVARAHGESLAALIVEPYMARAGVIPPADGYLQHLRRITQQRHVLLIFDEVQSFRLGPGGAQGYYGVIPDLTAFGKMIGGGFPVGAFGGREDVMKVYSPEEPGHVIHAGTFNGNAAIMAAGIATLRELTPSVFDRLNRLGERLQRGLIEAFDEIGVLGGVSRVGSSLNLHFSPHTPKDFRASMQCEKRFLPHMHLGLINRGIFTARRGFFNIMTPMGEEEVQEAVKAFRAALREIRPAIEKLRPDLVG